MRATVIPAAELSPDVIQRWRGALAANPLLQTPLLDPLVYRAIGRHRSNVRVAIGATEDAREFFFPFEHASRLASSAAPVPLCDYQAVVSAEQNRFGLADVLRAAKVQSWRFDHLLAASWLVDQATVVKAEPSWRVVLPDGFDAYVATLGESGKSMRNVRTKSNLLKRDHGEVRFNMDDRNPEALQQILQWKAQRFEEGDSVFSISPILEELFAVRDDCLSPVLSTLSCDDTIVAAHFGLRARGTIFYWFPGFNPAFAKYTPGLLLIQRMMQHMQSLGCDTLDFGPGGEKYKTYFANADVVVPAGYIELPSAINLGRAAWRSIDRAVRSNRVSRTLLRPVARLLRRARR